MYHHSVDAATINRKPAQDIWDVDWGAHPLLDPDFAGRDSRLAVLTRLTFRRILRSDQAYARELARLFVPANAFTPQDVDLASLSRRAAEYLGEADVYLDSTIALLPAPARDIVRPQHLVTECRDMRDLMGISIHGKSERVRYEARRKLCLAQLLLQIDQSRSIQDGPRHKAMFEEILNETLWRHSKQIHDLSIGYRISDDRSKMEYTSRPEPGDQRWDFRSTFIEKRQDDRSVALDILYYNCRFKRSVTPVSFEIVDGSHRVLERVRWGEMRQQTSGSILSKMIRKGITNPDEIGDIIGAMFIVHDNDALADLLLLLDAGLGTPFGWRNVTDTLSDQRRGDPLNIYSGRGFKVFKGDLDVLVEDEGGGPPYRFPVEIQIFTLEGYLRTVCGLHEASHMSLKLRQFLFGLAPRIFPRQVYGTQWLEHEAARGPHLA